MGIDNFLKDIPPLSDEEATRLLKGFSDTLGTWLLAWGDKYSVPPEKRFDAFMAVADLGYRIAKRDIEADKWNSLLEGK
jgi:hypothetical protein